VSSASAVDSISLQFFGFLAPPTGGKAQALMGFKVADEVAFLFLFICFTQYQHADVGEAGASDTSRHAIVVKLERGKKHHRTTPLW
jgi:hypothetical protein